MILMTVLYMCLTITIHFCNVYFIANHFLPFCFVHPIYHFWFLFTFGDEVAKILHNLCLQFARPDGQDGKKQERESCN